MNIKETYLQYIFEDKVGEEHISKLIKVLIFSKHLGFSEKESHLLMNYIYDNYELLNENDRELYEYFIRKNNFYSHKRLPTNTITDYLHLHNKDYLSSKQLDLLEFIENIKKEYSFISAPTSFGKSKIINEEIISKHSKIIIILPNKALINEYKKKLLDMDLEHYVTSNPRVDIAKEKMFIFACTQERLNISNVHECDVIIVDEAQSINNIEDARTLELIYALKRFHAKKIFIAPYIQIQSLINAYQYLMKEQFVYEAFVAMETDSLVSKRNYYVNMTSKKKVLKIKYLLNNQLKTMEYQCEQSMDKYQMCVKVMSLRGHMCEKNIIYCGIPKGCSDFAEVLVKYTTVTKKNQVYLQLVEYIKDQYGEQFDIIKYLNKGILLHNGRYDPFIRRIGEYLYNETNAINNIVATSTISSGVNLECQNLFYLRKGKNEKLHQTKNIAGRSGRFKKHNMGNNYYFRGETKEEIKEAETNSNLIKIEEKQYKSTEDTKLYDDGIFKRGNEKKKIFKYYIKEEEYDSLVRCFTDMEIDEVINIYKDPFLYENLKKLFDIYFTNVKVLKNNQEVNPSRAGYFAYIFLEYLSTKSIKSIIDTNLKRGNYYRDNTGISYSPNQSKVIEKNNTTIRRNDITNSEYNELIYQRINDNVQYCEFMLKRAIGITMYVINNVLNHSESMLDNLVVNLEYNVLSNDDRVLLETLSNLGVEDKFLTNAILSNSQKSVIKDFKSQKELLEFIKREYPDKQYYTLSLEL